MQKYSFPRPNGLNGVEQIYTTEIDVDFKHKSYLV